MIIMFEYYYDKLRFSQELSNSNILSLINLIENKRNYFDIYIKNKDIHCHKGCNLCCHVLDLKMDIINAFILLRIFETIPYKELYPYFKLCVDNRIKAQEYIDSLSTDCNKNTVEEVYNKLGFTDSTCPFVDKQNGCLIYKFRPNICFEYVSSYPCKFSFNQEEGISGLKNDKKMYRVEYNTLENNDISDELLIEIYRELYRKLHKKDPIFQKNKMYNYFNTLYDIFDIVSTALEVSDPEKYKNDMEGINCGYDIFRNFYINKN